MAKKDISMTTEEIHQLLGEAQNLQVATLGRDGFPHLTTLWFCLIDGRVTFRSFTKSQRVVNLDRDNRLTVLAEMGSEYDELRGAMIQGRAHLDRDPHTVMRVYAEVTRKQQGLDEIDPDVVEAMFGRFKSKNTVITVEPERTTSWDHRKLKGY